MTPVQSEGSPPHRTARWFVWTFAGDLAGKAAVLVTTFVAARAMDPVSFGQFVGMMAVGLVAAAVWDVGVSIIATRSVASHRLDGGDALRQALRLRVTSAAVWIVTFAGGTYVVIGDSPLPLAMIAAFLVLSGGSSLAIPVLAVLRGQLRFREASACFVAGRWIGVLLCLVVVDSPLHSSSDVALAGAIALGEIVTLLVGGWLVLRDSRDPIERGGRASAQSLGFREAAPFGANTILSAAYGRFDVLLVVGLASTQQLGLYAPASRIQDALMLIPSTVSAVALPVLARALQSPERGAVVRVMLYLFIAGVVISLAMAAIVFAFAPSLLTLALGPDYAGATTATRILVWSLPLAAATAPLLAILAASGRGVETTTVFLVAFVVAIAMHVILDPRLGAIGGAIASLSREPAALAAAFVVVWRAGLFRHEASRSASERTSDSRLP